MEIKLRKMFENNLKTHNCLKFIQAFDILTASMWELLAEDAIEELDILNGLKENTNTERFWGSDLKENLKNYERMLRQALEEGSLLIDRNNVSLVTTSLGRSREGAEDVLIEYLKELKETVSEEKRIVIKNIIRRYVRVFNILLRSIRDMYVEIGCEKYLELEDFSDIDLRSFVNKIWR